MMEELRDAISKELDNLDTQLSQRMKLVISVRPDDLSTAVDLSCLSVVQQVLTVVTVIQNSVTTLLLDSISLYHLSNLCWIKFSAPCAPLSASGTTTSGTRASPKPGNSPKKGVSEGSTEWVAIRRP